MADEGTRTEENTGGEGVSKGSKLSILDNKLVMLGLIIVLQAVTAFAIVKFVVVPRLAVAEPQAKTEAQYDAGEGVLAGLDEMVVTLRDGGPSPDFLRINVNLEVADKKIAEQVTRRLPQLRDIVILTLSNKTGRELKTLEGKEALKAEIMDKVGATLPEGGLKNVYFSDMVVQ